MQTLNDKRIISEQSNLTVKSIRGMLPIPRWGSRLNKGMEDVLPALSGSGMGGQTMRQIQSKIHRSEDRMQIGLCPKGLWFGKLSME